MKIKSSLVIGTCLATLILCAPLAASAKTKSTAIPFRGKISSVDADAKTFSIASKGSTRVIKITDQTKITKQGAEATMKDVVADEEVRGSYEKKEDGSLEARTVKLGSLTAEEMAKRDARKQKKAEKKAETSPSPAK